MALLPILYLVLRALEGGGEQIAETLLRPYSLQLFLNSVLLATTVTIAATALGVSLAWATTRLALPLPGLWKALAALPLAVPTYVAGYAWISTFPQLDGFPGAWLVLTLYSYPYVYLPVAAALMRVDPGLEESARSLGRSPVHTFMTVTLPQLRPAVAAGALLIALYALSDFGAVSLMRFDVFTNGIYLSYQASFDRTPAAILGCVLVALTVLIVAGEARTRGRRRYAKVGSGGVRALPPVKSVLTAPALLLSLATAAVALGLPAAVLTGWLVSGLSTPAIDAAVDLTLNSLMVSVAGAAVTVAAGFPIALYAVRRRSRLSGVVERASYAGHALPGIVVALSLVFFASQYATALYQRLPLVIFAYLVLFLPLAVGAVQASLAQAPPSLSEVARSLGRRPFSVLTAVTIPLTGPGIAAGLALVFLTCMKELPATLLLRPTGYDTLATRVWTDTGSGAFAAAALPAAILVVVAAVPTYLLAKSGTMRT